MPSNKKSQATRKVSNGGPVARRELVTYLDTLLRTKEIKDVSCNGLQVQGADFVSSIAFTVDACMAAYIASVEQNCQMLITHHGMIWDGLRSITGTTYNQVKFLLDNKLNLYASHLPLDLHPKYGNNAQLCSLVGLNNIKPFGLYKGIQIGFEGSLRSPSTLDEISSLLNAQLNAESTVLPFGPDTIKRVAIVSGGAGNELTEAIDKEIDLYITGESVHHNYHAALEAKINVIYCGHYESETVGVKALGIHLEEKFGIEAIFLDIPTSI